MPSNPNKPFELRNISRIDKPSKLWNSENHGWQVRFLRNRKPISQWFEDNKHGNKENALKAAKLYRDSMEKELSIVHKGKYIEANVTEDNLVGVSKRTKKYNYKSGPNIYHTWEAMWPTITGKKDHKAFGIEKYGEKEALRLAIAARNEGVKKYFEDLKKQQVHIAFKPPTKTDIKIWRYMDFTKFVSMLQNSGLYLSRVDLLNDPFEGSFSNVNKLLRPLFHKHKTLSQNSLSNLIETLRKYIVVNCWHMNEQESAAMWSLYAKSEEAICIQSTYSKLKSALPIKSQIGIVQYIDYEKDWIEENDPLLPFLYKRKSFEHEREIRVIENLSGLQSINDNTTWDNPPDGGTWVKVELNKLIDKLFIAPQADEWFKNLVENETKNYGLNIPVRKSSLEAEPFF